VKTAQKRLLQKLSYSRLAFLFILVFSVLRIIVAFTMELGTDEAYYWFYSQDLKLNYFDHPPMVALLVRLFTLNLRLQDYEGFIRLGSIAGCGLSAWFIFKTCTLLHSPRAGVFGVCLYNVSFYAGITAGLFIMPDSPQMVFYTFSLWMIARITADEDSWLNWILFGAAAGLCIMSKVHGVFLWVGLGLFIILFKRGWLTNLKVYVALLLSIIISSPIVAWSLQYDYASYRFNSERVIIKDDTIHLKSFLTELASQFFFNNPFNVIVTVGALAAYAKKKMQRTDALAIYNLISLPLALILLVVSLFRNTTLPHWSGPAYVALIPVAAIRIADTTPALQFPKLVRAGIAGFIVFVIAWQCVLYFYPGTYGSKEPGYLGKGDVTLDKYGRREAGDAFARFYENEVKQGAATTRTPVVYYKWWAADIEYYFCRPYGIQMIGLGTMNNLHEYMWMNERRKSKVDMNVAYCIVPSEDRNDLAGDYAAYYRSKQLAAVIHCFRGNRPARNFFVYRMNGWKTPGP